MFMMVYSETPYFMVRTAPSVSHHTFCCHRNGWAHLEPCQGYGHMRQVLYVVSSR